MNETRPKRLEQESIDLMEVLVIMLTHWWKVAVCTLLGALIAFGLAYLRYTPTYQATAKIYVNNNNISIGMTQVSITAADLSASQTLVNIYQEFINTHYVLDTVGEALEREGMSGYNYYNLRSRVTTASAGETQFLTISVKDFSPEDAIKVTNILVDTLKDLADDVIKGASITAVDPAYNAVLQPSPVRNTTMKGAIAGFVLAAGLILLYYYFLNDAVTSQSWLLDTYSDIPDLGLVPDTSAESGGNRYYAYRRRKKPEGERAEEPNKQAGGEKHTGSGRRRGDIGEALSFAGVEAYNVIRTNIKFSVYRSAGGRCIGITSASAGDGKSYTAMNVAYALAKDGAKVLLVDGDMRKPSLAHYLENDCKTGLSELLCGEVPFEASVQEGVLHENLSVLFSGQIPPNPSELLGTAGMGEFLQEMRKGFNYVLIDLPPVGSVVDAVAVSDHLDGIVMVVRHNQTKKKYIRSTVRQFKQCNVRLLGFVYNAMTESGFKYGGYYKRYYYDYAYRRKNSPKK